MKLEKTVLGRFGMKTQKKMNGITGPVKVKYFFWDSNPEFGPPFGDVVAENSCGMAHNRFEPVSGEPFENAEMLQPLLVADTYCPTGCLPVRAFALLPWPLLDVEASATAAAAAAGCSACCACR